MITIHAGHNKQGYTGAGAVSTVKYNGKNITMEESRAARRCKRRVKRKLLLKGVKLIDGTVNKKGASPTDVLKLICSKINGHGATAHFSIHCDAYNGKANGTGILVFDASKPVNVTRYKKKMMDLGYTWRGITERKNLYVMRHSDARMYLLEIFFCDNEHDVKIWKKNWKKVADAVVAFIIDNM